MNQTEALQFLKRDLEIVTSHLELADYQSLFEEELKEYYPFKPEILDWLTDIYQGEKYESFDESKLSLYYEKKHPFLFIRDLAHLNSWNLGYQNQEMRQTHITGLMFSGQTEMALEATLCLCRPTRVQQPAGSWFDYKQAMKNLENLDDSEYHHQALKASAMFYLYFYLTQPGTPIVVGELKELLNPYEEGIARALVWGSASLRKECGILAQVMSENPNQTLLDKLQSRY